MNYLSFNTICQLVCGSVEGYNLYQHQKASITYAIDRKEQKYIYSIIQFDAIHVCCSQIFRTFPSYAPEFAKRFSFLNSMILHAALATLHLLPEYSKRMPPYMRKCCELISLHIPTAIQVLSTMYAAFCVFNNKSRLRYSLHLFFNMLVFLENGVFLKEPKEKQGLFFSFNTTKKIVKLYSSYFSNIAILTYPVSLYLSQSLYGRIRIIIDACLFGVGLLPKQEEDSKILKEYNKLFEKTNIDAYSTQTFAEAKQRIENQYINNKTTQDGLSKKEEELLEDTTVQLLELYEQNQGNLLDIELKLKNIFMCMLDHPKEAYTIIGEEEQVLLCEANRLRGMNDLYFRMLPYLCSQNNNDLKNSKLMSRIKIITQKFKDDSFQAYIQEMRIHQHKLGFMFAYRWFDSTLSFEEYMKIMKEIEEWNSPLISKRRIKYLLKISKTSLDYAIYAATNLHQSNKLITKYGEGLGLSYDEFAVQDCNDSPRSKGKDRLFLRLFGCTNVLRKKFLVSYLSRWYDHLIEHFSVVEFLDISEFDRFCHEQDVEALRQLKREILDTKKALEVTAKKAASKEKTETEKFKEKLVPILEQLGLSLSEQAEQYHIAENYLIGDLYSEEPFCGAAFYYLLFSNKSDMYIEYQKNKLPLLQLHIEINTTKKALGKIAEETSQKITILEDKTTQFKQKLKMLLSPILKQLEFPLPQNTKAQAREITKEIGIRLGCDFSKFTNETPQQAEQYLIKIDQTIEKSLRKKNPLRHWLIVANLA